MRTTISLEGSVSPDQSLTYLHLPFDMPEGVVRLDVRYEYSDAIGSDPQLKGGNTVDIGIFDARGTDFMTGGFRGWSGSARSEFFIALDDATPGYIQGPLQPGTWHIFLGFYKVAESGCDYCVTVELIVDANTETQASFPTLLPLRDAPRPDKRAPDGWYKGELHCHTYHSDGDSDPLDVVRLAESLGLDFLAITDHNVLTHRARLREIETPLMLIPGTEVTTYKGHWNVWGDCGWIDFRTLSQEKMRQAIIEAVQRGYLVSCNHPRPYGPEWVYEAVDEFHCVEVWNGPWEIFNETALEFWETKLRAGKRYPAVGGSDSHFLRREHIARLGHPTTWIHCDGDPSPAKLLAALRAGHAFITEAPDGPELYLESNAAMMGDLVRRPDNTHLPLTIRVARGAGLALQIIAAEGCLRQLPIKRDQQQFKLDVGVEDTPYVRAQLVDSASQSLKVHALTNPIYLT